MSKTDKTNPHWVKAARREWGIRETHVHHGKWFHGACVVGVSMPQTRRNGEEQFSCHVFPSYYMWRGDKVYGRHPKGKARKECGQDGRARATLRRLRHKWMRAAEVEDIDSFEAAPYKRWLWAKWYWD